MSRKILDACGPKAILRPISEIGTALDCKSDPV